MPEPSGTPDSALSAQVAAHRARFEAAMDDDFNTPQALGALFDLAAAPLHGPGSGGPGRWRAGQSVLAGARQLVALARVLGLLEEPAGQRPDIAQEMRARIEELISRRVEARRRRDFSEADRVRNELQTMGVVLEDTRDGTTWKLSDVTHPGDETEAPLFGRHPVLELLRAESRRVDEVAILADGRGPALQDLLSLARRRGVKIAFRTRDQLTAIAGTPHHQGVVARVAAASYADVDDLLAEAAERAEPAFVLALDQVQDPRNLGAILRSAEATGAHGVILPKHHSAGLTPAAAKSGAGAAEWLRVARVSNLVQALEALKKSGIWVIGTVVRDGLPPWSVDLTSAGVPGPWGRGHRLEAAGRSDLRLPGQPADEGPAWSDERLGGRGRHVLRGVAPARSGWTGCAKRVTGAKSP